MSLFYQGNDPLLTQRTTTSIYPPLEQDPYEHVYRQQLLEQLREPTTPQQKDWIGELDGKVKSLSPEILTALSANSEFTKLNSEIQGAIQSEIMILVRDRLNRNPDIVSSAKRQLELIDQESTKQKEEERQSMSELNDYMKNYSHLTFDEYKKVKSKKNETR